MSIPKAAEDLLNTVELDTEKYRYLVERSDIFRTAGNILIESGFKERAQQLEWEFLLFRFMINLGNKPNERFAPMIVYTNGHVFPDIKSFVPEQIDYYQKRADETKNSIHKAIYSDFIWETKRNYVYAITAVKAYLESAEIYYKNDWEIELIDALQRATNLARTLNDTTSIEEARVALVHFIESLSASKKYRWCLELIESVLSIKQYLKSDELDTCIVVAEAGLKHYRTVDDGFHLQRAFMELLMELLKAKKKPEEALKYAFQIADSFEKEGSWKLKHYPSGDLVAAHFYAEAAANYRELGQREKLVNC